MGDALRNCQDLWSQILLGIIQELDQELPITRAQARPPLLQSQEPWAQSIVGTHVYKN